MPWPSKRFGISTTVSRDTFHIRELGGIEHLTGLEHIYFEFGVA